jgi:hypothetical protein
MMTKLATLVVSHEQLRPVMVMMMMMMTRQRKMRRRVYEVRTRTILY